MTGLYIIGGILLIILIFLIVLYNKLIRLRNMVSEGWSGIDVQLKKRYDLIPKLVDTVQGYAKHEKELFREITESRTKAIAATSVSEQGNAESAINRSIDKLLVAVEAYPDLKANQNFLDLQRELSKVEEDIALSRRYYNGTVRNINIAIESFPNNMVAGMFGFGRAEFFEIEDIQREIPKTK